MVRLVDPDPLPRIISLEDWVRLGRTELDRLVQDKFEQGFEAIGCDVGVIEYWWAPDHEAPTEDEWNLFLASQRENQK